MGTTTMSCFNQLNIEMLTKLGMELKITENKLNLDLGDLFQLGARKNPKRSFLFISKLLGKHIGIHPIIPRLSGALLANLFAQELEGKTIFDTTILLNAWKNNQLNENILHYLQTQKIKLDKPTLILGFAETATGLGHSFFVPFSNAYYLHTTRDNIQNLKSVFTFEEEHSHATSHLCYATDKNIFNQFERIVLVDDEITTGKTALNLIEALNKYYPNKEYVVISILDWRNQEDQKRFSMKSLELNCPLHVISLVKGEVTCENKMLYMNEPQNRVVNTKTKVTVLPLNLPSGHTLMFDVKNEDDTIVKRMYYSISGRFGLSANEHLLLEEQMREFAKQVEEKRMFNETVAIGAGEFIFLPSMISSCLSGDIKYQSSTRSPIYVNTENSYPIQNKIVFQNPDDHSITNFIYNIVPNKYKEAILFFEREVSKSFIDFMTKELSDRGIQHLMICYFK